ncbi:MAG: hypothetical protein HT580_06545 [Dechloromonas sp.]|nr:MAG: hypothetical protein HT580_06545 [Dechloromonas sp.]
MDFSSLLAAYGPGYAIDMDACYGSVDTYNGMRFYNGNSLIAGSGLLADGILTGTEILSAMNGQSGNQLVAQRSNQLEFALVQVGPRTLHDRVYY